MDWNNDDDIVFGFIRVGVLKVSLFLVLSIVALVVFTAAASAESFENATVSISGGSSIVVEELTTEPTPIPTNVPVGRRIYQGECVVPGETIDIAGIGWYTGQLVYYGRYYDGFSGAGNSSVKALYSVRSQDLDHFYVEPSFFSQYTGWWYAVETYEDTGNAKGNDRIFRVENSCHTVKENVTIMQEAINQTLIRQAILANMTHLPVKKENGISVIISRNATNSFNIPDPESRYWIFGPDSGGKYYDRSEEPFSDRITFTQEMTNDLNDDVYSVIFVSPGRNTIVEETYDASKEAMSSPFREPEDLDMRGFSPMVVRDRLIQRISESRDDSYVEWKVALQDPSILIMKFSQEPLGSNVSYVAVSGYTNANVGDEITLVLDKALVNAETREKSTWHATVVDNGGMDAYRTWNTSFIIDFNNAFPGQHDITATTESGASAIVPIYFRHELPGHYIPPVTVNFIDNSPFLPTPTPEIIIKEVPGPVVTKIVTVTITPSTQQIHKEAEGVAFVWVAILVVVVMVIIAFAALVLWLNSVYRRTRMLP